MGRRGDGRWSLRGRRGFGLGPGGALPAVSERGPDDASPWILERGKRGRGQFVQRGLLLNILFEYHTLV